MANKGTTIIGNHAAHFIVCLLFESSIDQLETAVFWYMIASGITSQSFPPGRLLFLAMILCARSPGLTGLRRSTTLAFARVCICCIPNMSNVFRRPVAHRHDRATCTQTSVKVCRRSAGLCAGQQTKSCQHDARIKVKDLRYTRWGGAR